MSEEKSFHAWLTWLLKVELMGSIVVPVAVGLPAAAIIMILGSAQWWFLAVFLASIPAFVMMTLFVPFSWGWLMRCPACRKTALGGFFARGSWQFWATTDKLAPTHCYWCRTDLRELTYRPGRLWIPKGVDEK